jgi:hypothetical protein
MEPFTSIAVAVASKAATTALEPLLKRLVDAQSAQSAELERIHHDVRRLIDGPWRRSHLHLRAASDATEPARRMAELDHASRALLEAYSFQQEPSATRSLIAADLAAIEGMLGRRADAERWAQSGRADARAFLTSTSSRLEAELNRKPSLSERMKSWVQSSFWDEVVGVLSTVPDLDREARTDMAVARRRQLLEDGPDAPPGWRAVPAEGKWHESQYWHGLAGSDMNPVNPFLVNRERIDYSRYVIFRDGDLPAVRAIIDLHATARRANSLSEVCQAFGRTDSMPVQLTIRLRERYHARIAATFVLPGRRLGT